MEVVWVSHKLGYMILKVNPKKYAKLGGYIKKIRFLKGGGIKRASKFLRCEGNLSVFGGRLSSGGLFAWSKPGSKKLFI